MTRNWVVMRAAGFADGRFCPVAGQYLKSFDFEAAGGLGYGEFTPDPAEAMNFPDTGAALTFWRTQSRVRPQRRDGKPNRPLTCTTFEIVDEAEVFSKPSTSAQPERLPKAHDRDGA